MSLIPGSLDPIEFARARTCEVQLLQQDIHNAKMINSTRRVFQTLPRHMRRRAASFHINRLPTRLRLRALEEVCQYLRDADCVSCTVMLLPCTAIVIVLKLWRFDHLNGMLNFDPTAVSLIM